jgi:uncharacterized protein YxjI
MSRRSPSPLKRATTNPAIAKWGFLPFRMRNADEILVAVRDPSPTRISNRSPIMRYVMKQKLLAWGDDFTIKDADGADRFFVDGKVFSIGDKLSFQDMQGNELARIEQKVLSLFQQYRIFRDGQLIATVMKKPFTLFHDAFELEDAAPGDFDATGDFFDREYTFTRDGRTIARVSKKFFSWTDTYGVDIAAGEDDVLILAATVVIDQCCHEDKEK